MVKLQAYEYPLKDNEGSYNGYYTIKEGAKPLGLKGEHLVSTFDFDDKKPIDWEKESQW